MADTRHLAVKGGLVLTPAFDAVRADILIRDGVILAVVPPGATLPEDTVTVDATDRAVMPGLVNAHVHGHGTLAKGLVEDHWPLDLFLNALPGLGGHRTPDDMRLNGLVGAVEMIRKGTTACFDLFFEYPRPSREGLFAVAQAYDEAGLRAVVAPMVADRSYYEAYPDLVASMTDAERADASSVRMGAADSILGVVAEAVRAWPFDRSRVCPGLAPAIPLHCTDAFLSGCRDLARDYALPVQTHLAETRVQAIEGKRRYGSTITAHLDALGLLGPDFSAAHGIWLDADDLGLLADRGATIVHAPTSNLRFGSGIAPIRAAMDRGVAIGLATDAANSSDHLNMFEALRAAASVSTLVTTDFDRWLGASDVLGFATEGSARAMGMAGRIGRIAPGFEADLVFLDLGHINYVPLGNLARQIVFTENAGAVDSVMIAGRMVLERGRMTTVDEPRLRRDAQAAANRLYEANRPGRDRSARLQPAVARFCAGFGCQPYHVHRLACAPPG